MPHTVVQTPSFYDRPQTDDTCKSNTCASIARSLVNSVIGWVVPIVAKGYKSPLDKSDVSTRLPRTSNANVILQRAEGLWDDERSRRGEDANLLRVMVKLQKHDLVLGTVVSVVQGILFAVARPLLLRQLILVISEPDSPLSTSVVVATLFSLVTLLEGILQVNVKQILHGRVGATMVAWLTSILQHKATTVSSVAAAASPLQASALVGHDVIRLVEELRWFSIFPYAVTSIIGGIGVLIYTLGVASVAGFFVMGSIILISTRITKRIKKVEMEDLQVGDKRVTIMKETIDGIKPIKMMAWENPFQHLLKETRERETTLIRMFRTLQVTSINLGRSSPVVSASVSILLLALVGGDNFVAADIFAAISAFQSLRLPLISLPNNMSQMANFLNSFKRFTEYMCLEEMDVTDKVRDDGDFSLEIEHGRFTWNAESPEDQTVPDATSTKALSFKFDAKNSKVKKVDAQMKQVDAQAKQVDAQAKQADDDVVRLQVRGDDDHDHDDVAAALNSAFQLNDINVKVPRHGGLVAVVGKVGSGKTSLLSSALGCLLKTRGSLRVSNSISYVPQKPFILSGTLKENIVMDQPFDERQVDKVVRAAAMDEDIKLFQHGLDTEIGERGQTLSGGQQQRLSIARALYREPELLVMDDPLAAVDPGVATTIFKRTVLGYVNQKDGTRHRHKSVIMAINQLHLLPEFDQVVVMQNGEIVEQGDYEALMRNSGGVLSQMLQGLDSFAPIDNEQLDRHAAAKAEGKSTSDGATTTTTNDVANISNPTAHALDELDDTIIQRESSTDGVSHHLNEVSANIENADVNVEENTVETLDHGDIVATGKVSSGVLWEYFKAVGKWHLPVLFLLATTGYGLMAANDLWLVGWVQRSDEEDPYISHLASAAVYFALSISHVTFVQLISIFNTRATTRASKRVHDECVEHLLHAPISWFEGTPSGRIIGRFSGDISMVDRQLAFIVDDCCQFLFLMCALCILICYIIPWLIVVVVVGIFAFVIQLVAVDRSNREVKRFANQSLSPVLTNLSETMNARSIIQVMRLEKFFCRRHWEYIDEFNRYAYCSTSMINWGTLLSAMMSFVLATVAVVVVVLQRDQFDPSLVGLALTYSFLIPYFLSILSMVIPIGFTALTSLERVLEYKGPNVPQEPAWYIDEVDKKLVPDDQAVTSGKGHTNSVMLAPMATVVKPTTLVGSEWPSRGEIVFEDVSLIYRPGLPPALKNVSVKFDAQSKVGIIGRTGAGKSSLTMLLFRVNEAATGRILIDGQDISTMGLQLLRSSLTIIPQSPLLLSGSVRMNLDPFDEHDDETIARVVRRVGLPPSLLEDESNLATSLSIGERQMMSLARVLLRQNLRVVIMDEPTANIDFETDEEIQKVVREEFKGSTVLTIAHRLATVIDSDKILVMDKGTVSQYGPAKELIKDTDGIFHSMVTGMGESSAKMLMSKAK